jgi:hypothetical protein
LPITGAARAQQQRARDHEEEPHQINNDIRQGKVRADLRSAARDVDRQRGRPLPGGSSKRRSTLATQMYADNEEQPEPLSLGSVVEPSMDNKPWREAIRALSVGVADARQAKQVPLNLNVVFHVPGRQFKPEFSGVRTGRYSAKDRLLMVQVAVPETVPEDPNVYVRDAVDLAIDEATRWAARKKIEIDSDTLRMILDAA